MTKSLNVLFLIIVLFSFKQIEKTKNIDGKWYSSSPIKLEDNTIDYTEFFIKNDTVHIYSEYMLRMAPRNMILKKDSLFFSSKSNSNFVGNILKHSEVSFDLGINNINKRTYYKLTQYKTLENLIKEKISEKEYHNEFMIRMNNEYKKTEKKVSDFPSPN